jgi:hypothetical protein
LTLHHAQAELPSGFPAIEAASLSKITTPEHMAALLAGPLGEPNIVIVRVLGGISSVPGFGLLKQHIRSRGRHLLVLSGTGAPGHS